MLKFRTGDKIKVTAGKDKGREGKIEKVFPLKMKALIPEVNMYKRHVKAAQGREGGIYDIPRPLPFAKIALICPKCNKTTRVGFRVAGGTKVRVCKKCGREIESVKTPKKAKK